LHSRKRRPWSCPGPHGRFHERAPNQVRLIECDLFTFVFPIKVSKCSHVSSAIETTAPPDRCRCFSHVNGAARGHSESRGAFRSTTIGKGIRHEDVARFTVKCDCPGTGPFDPMELAADDFDAKRRASDSDSPWGGIGVRSTIRKGNTGQKQNIDEDDH
jgi:hypothetical protein